MYKKLVYESLNEVISFERKKNPLSTLGIGKTNLIINWLKEMEVEDYKINDDFTIDNKGIVNLCEKNLKKFPSFIQFNKVDGVFWCFRNQLISLRGCPKYVGVTFSCSNNQLTSLKGCPLYVGDRFVCFNNKVYFTQEYIRKLCEVKNEIINKK